MHLLLAVIAWVHLHWVVSSLLAIGMATAPLLPSNTGVGSVRNFGAFTFDTFAQLAAMLYELSSTPLTGTADTVVTAGAPSTTYSIDTAAIDAIVLKAPNSGNQNAGGDSGKMFLFMSGTAFVQTGSAAVNVATFAAFAGANVLLRAHQGKFQVVSSNGVTFS